MSLGRAVLAALAASLAGCGGSCNQTVPQSDICELAPGAPRPTVTAVQIGQFAGGTFTPIEDDAVVELVVGGQGSDMIVTALRITGDALPSCMAQETILEEADGDLITSEIAPMSTRPAGAGAVVTGDILLPYYGLYGGRVRLRTTVSGATDAVEFWAGEMGEVDAAVDARTDAATDAVVPDALATDATPDA